MHRAGGPTGRAFVTLRPRHTQCTLSSNKSSLLFRWDRGQQPGAARLAWHPHGQHFTCTLLPRGETLCVPIHPAVTTAGVVIIFNVLMPRQILQTRSSDTTGRSCRNEAPFRSVPRAPLLFMTCLRGYVLATNILKNHEDNKGCGVISSFAVSWDLVPGELTSRCWAFINAWCELLNLLTQWVLFQLVKWCYS